jgi:hypothetical protein
MAAHHEDPRRGLQLVLEFAPQTIDEIRRPTTEGTWRTCFAYWEIDGLTTRFFSSDFGFPWPLEQIIRPMNGTGVKMI